ncbi:hypothetical protein [Jiangella asiatica]|uniref:Adaptive response protein AidB N-terminal domain-containing protein n=1 Tax=Jiangella asiatica TaxID=2530372 RepID=A0A4R5CVQ2_9ACTN|nr:hypothetical protein [Jiangella asiatica]TDE03101.1 hypothetical protein E1269_20810 [Jiangella asiatica]
MAATHEVTNQLPPLTGYEVFGADARLAEAFDRYGDAGMRGWLHGLGRLAGSADAQQGPTPRP